MKAFRISGASVLFVAILSVLLFCTSCALAEEEDYTFQNGVICRYNGSEDNLVIPDTIHGEPVVQIGLNAFAHNEHITSVSIPASVSTIGSMAFYDCSNLSSLSLSEGLVTVGSGAFDGASKLFSVTLPKSVQHIGSTPFDYHLVKLTILNPDVTFDSGAESMESGTYYKAPLNSSTFNQLKEAKLKCIVDEVVPHLYQNYSSDPNCPTTVYSGDMLNFDNAEGILMSMTPIRKNDANGRYIVGNVLFPNYASYITGNANEIEADDGFFKFVYPVTLTIMPVIESDSGDWIAAPVYYFLLEDPGVVESPELINLPLWGTQKDNRGMWLDDIPIEWHGTADALYTVELVRYSFRQTEGGSMGMGVVCHSQQGLTDTSAIIPASVLQHGKMYSITVAASVGSVKREVHSERFIVVEPADDDKVVSIPRNALALGEEAFMDDLQIEEVRFSDENTTSIGTSCFMNCQQLRLISIPSSVEAIGEAAFSNCPNLVILCHKGSVAENHAIKNQITHILLESGLDRR